MELEKLYREKVPSSLLTDEQLNFELTWLINKNSAESIFFAINHCSRKYPKQTEESLKFTFNRYKEEILRNYEIALIKRDIAKLKESEVNYDPENKHEGDNKPSWFRKSFNIDLFK